MLKSPETDNYCIDRRQKILWIRVPKVASTSIRQAWLEPLAPKQSYLKAIQTNCYTVMFVRDPIDRFLSAYKRNFRHWKLDQLVNELITLQPVEVNKHLRPQWTFQRGLTVDFIGKYENLTEDWDKLRERFKLRKLPWANRSLSSDHHLTKEQLIKLKTYYQKDYDIYYQDN